MSLFIGNISRQASYRELEKAFKAFGHCKFNPRGKYGFVEFDREKDAEEAIDSLQGKFFGGSRITIHWSKKSGHFDEKTEEKRRNKFNRYESRSRSRSRRRRRRSRSDSSRSKSRKHKKRTKSRRHRSKSSSSSPSRSKSKKKSEKKNSSKSKSRSLSKSNSKKSEKSVKKEDENTNQVKNEEKTENGNLENDKTQVL